ncbi:MAG TPA: class I SAM-dependent methyltransferase [Pyrinomonadaceae bacterium]|jgi:SAM-dependent methyltransferase|nr:class I SAM-dependent methyltransferase [Pyrinomonadaceae bacterium]
MTPNLTHNEPRGESRTHARLQAHYAIERELAERLRRAGRDERRVLYTALYDELFRRVPDHPQLTRKEDAETIAASVGERMMMLRRFLRADSTYLEIGAGDCALAREVAGGVRQVFAVDVSQEIAGGRALPENCALVISDGCSIPLGDNAGGVDVAFSDQLMEHLHPDDAFEQLRNIYNALKPGGVYLCLTPSRLTGPHDISAYFDDVATGFHLKEYTAAELVALFRRAGFSRFKILYGARGRFLTLPVFTVKLVERALSALPRRSAKKLARLLPVRLLLGIKLIATK